MPHLVAVRDPQGRAHLLSTQSSGGKHLSAADNACDCCEQGTLFPSCTACVIACTAPQYRVSLKTSAGELSSCTMVSGNFILTLRGNRWRYDFPEGTLCNGNNIRNIELSVTCENQQFDATQAVLWELSINAFNEIFQGPGAVRIWQGRHTYVRTGGQDPSPECCSIPQMIAVVPRRPASFPFDDDGPFAGYNCCEWPNVELDDLQAA